MKQCCALHVDGPTGMCCDPDDCTPCCTGCPTCPTQDRVRPAMARSTDRHRSIRR